MPELVVGQAGKELTHNQALAVLDQLAQAVVVDKDLTAPPGSPVNGSMYIVATGATGAWAGQDGKLAYWLTTVSAWTFITPADGWSVWVTDESVRYERKAGAWVVVSTGGTSLPVVRSITGNETLALANINTFGVNSTVSNYTSTIPAQATVAWTADAELHFLPSNTGDITITAAAGVSLNGVAAGSLTLSTQNGAATLKRIGADSWWLGGVLGTTAEQRTALGLGTAAVANILGSVSQASGVPTGAIIERGSNANGAYVKFADGTQICTHIVTVTDFSIPNAYGSLFQGTRTFDFPASFVAAPIGAGDASVADQASWAGCAGTSAGTITIRAWDITSRSAGISVTVSYSAIGRWF